MEDDLIFLNERWPQYYENGRQPQLFRKWKTTSIFLKVEDDLIFIILFFKRKMTSLYLRMEDDLKKYKNIYIYLLIQISIKDFVICDSFLFSLFLYLTVINMLHVLLILSTYTHGLFVTFWKIMGDIYHPIFHREQITFLLNC